MALRLFDSLSRELRELRPSQPDGVFRFYNCGPTVWAPAHIGNFRTFVVNDVIRRLLELEFGADKVRHVRNITDVDDRTIGQARKEKRPLGEITQHWTKLFHEDCAALNLLPPHVEPSATGHIAEQVAMIEGLMATGHAYAAADGSVYFKIGSFPGYGALSRIKERELKVTNAVADADHKDDIGDFALWKAYKPEDDGDVHWPGPRGAAAGRPGWHIECSAMIHKHLGPTIDLHTGAVDLLFPHHENEIAQSECGNGAHFVNHWYHSEHLLVNGTTMSKSKGNYYTLRDLVEKGYSPMAVRYALIAGHPRKQLNFTLDSLRAAQSALNKLGKFGADLCSVGIQDVNQLYDPGVQFRPLEGKDPWADFWCALNDDLGLPAALGKLFEKTSLIWQQIEELHTSEHPPTTEDLRIVRSHILGFGRVLFVLGLRLPKFVEGRAQLEQSAQTMLARGQVLDPAITALADKRWAAKQRKDFKTADALRAEIQAAGWQMLDGKDGYKLEPLKSKI